MALTQDEIQALAKLVRQELDDALDPRFRSVDERFDRVTGHLDAVFKTVEGLKTEYTSVKHQIGELEKECA